MYRHAVTYCKSHGSAFTEMEPLHTQFCLKIHIRLCCSLQLVHLADVFSLLAILAILQKLATFLNTAVYRFHGIYVAVTLSSGIS